MQEKIKVLIAEDMEPIRKRYVHILSQNEEISVVADVGTGQEACEAARQYQPDPPLFIVYRISHPVFFNRSTVSGDGCPYLFFIAQEITANDGCTCSRNSRQVDVAEP